MKAGNTNIAEDVTRIVLELKDKPGALLPVLHAIQDELGYIPEEAVPIIAHELNQTRAEVHGVITFYHDFRSHAPGRHIVRICQAESCQAMGSAALTASAKEHLGIDFHQTTRDNAFSLEPVYCLGSCACSPTVMVDGEVHGRVSPERFREIVQEAKASTVVGGPADGPSKEAGVRTPQRNELNAGVHQVGRTVGPTLNKTAATVFVPRDSSALAMGAERVATAIAAEAKKRGVNLTITRNGSRGMFWLEPLIEVATPQGRIAYGPVAPSDVAGLFESGFLEGAKHRLSLGPTEEIPYFKNQERLTFARVGTTDPVSLEDYIAFGGYRGLTNALRLTGEQIIKEVTESGLRGRGGAAFPTGIKWKTAFDAPSMPKYVVCNADEGDSGTFSDRMVMEGDPFVLIEGMTIAGLAINAKQGYIYLRSEYPHAERALNLALEKAYLGGYLGEDVLGSGKAFHLEVRRGAGAYICGEETALLESLEGKRGLIRYRPPLPAVSGLFGQPTILNNVISLASVPIILDKGAAFYKNYGMGRSRGTLPFQLSGNIKRGGLVEKAFGLTLRQLLYDFGGGSFSGRPIRAIQIGGPLGAYVPESQFDTPLDYEAFGGIRAMLGHGGAVAFDDTVDMAQMARFAMEFCALESCGKCTPCRIGSTRGVEVIDKIIQNRNREANVHLLRDLCDVMLNGSLCGLGGLIPHPVMSAIRHFPGDFGVSDLEELGVSF